MSDDADLRPFNERFASMALEGFNAHQTLDVATILGQQLRPAADGSAKTATLVILAALRRAAVDALMELADVEPTNAVKIAQHQAHVRAFLLADKTVKAFIESGEQIWAELNREDREALAEIMDIELDDADLDRGVDFRMGEGAYR